MQNSSSNFFQKNQNFCISSEILQRISLDHPQENLLRIPEDNLTGNHNKNRQSILLQFFQIIPVITGVIPANISNGIDGEIHEEIFVEVHEARVPQGIAGIFSDKIITG